MLTPDQQRMLAAQAEIIVRLERSRELHALHIGETVAAVIWAAAEVIATAERIPRKQAAEALARGRQRYIEAQG